MKKIKRLGAILLVLLMFAGLCACKDKPENNDPSIVVEGTELSTALCTVIYDDTVWKYDAENLSDEEEYSFINFFIPGEDDEALVEVDVCVEVDSPKDFRDDLTYYGFDEYEYAVNNAYDFVKVGGFDCLKYEDDYTLYYFNRIEGAGATVSVKVDGQYSDENVEKLIAGVKFNIEDKGLEDGPWYWEGEPFSAPDSAAAVGAVSVSSKFIKVEDCIITKETFDHSVAVCGDKVYILVDGALKEYDFDGNTLKFSKDIAIEGDYDAINRTKDNTIWLSSFMEPVITMKDGVVTGTYEDVDNLSVHPSGTWGISWFTGNEAEKITFAGGAVASRETITYKELDTISEVFVDENNVYICGWSVNEDDGFRVYVYDQNGKLQKTLTGEDNDSLGSITYMMQTADGYLGFDGNMRTIVLWNADGSYLGELGDGDLFNTSYPWFCSGCQMDDGSVMIVMTEERADESAMELVAFVLSGF